MGIKQIYNDNLRKLPNEYGDVSVMRTKTNVIATVHFTDDDVIFLTAPECLFVKPQIRALTARELPS